MIEIPSAAVQVKRMDMEARSLAPDKGRPLLNKVREYKADLTSLREQLKQAAAGEAGGGAEFITHSARRVCLSQFCRSAVWQFGLATGWLQDNVGVFGA
jgi:hypothetical protein